MSSICLHCLTEIVMLAIEVVALRCAHETRLREIPIAYNSGTQKRAHGRSLGQRTGVLVRTAAMRRCRNSEQYSAADFLCVVQREFELKSQKGRFGAKVVDGAYKTKCERLAASNNPNLLLMNYDVKSLSVLNLLIVQPLFVREIIEERKPLAATARRAGWIGSNIILPAFPSPARFTS